MPCKGMVARCCKHSKRIINHWKTCHILSQATEFNSKCTKMNFFIIFPLSTTVNKISINMPTIWNIKHWRMTAFQMKSTITSVTKQHAVLKCKTLTRNIISSATVTKSVMRWVCESKRMQVMEWKQASLTAWPMPPHTVQDLQFRHCHRVCFTRTVSDGEKRKHDGWPTK